MTNPDPDKPGSTGDTVRRYVNGLLTTVYDWFRSFFNILFGLNETKVYDAAYYRARVAAWAFTFLLFGMVVVWACGQRCVGLFWSAACFAVGIALGFLFGIPRTVQVGAPRRPGQGEPAGAGPKPAPAEPGADYRQYVNTNLEDISDWLTKIIVGLTLVQFRDLAGYFRECAAALAAGLSGENDHWKTAFAQALIVYFTILGFLSGYLMTRLFLATAFRLADEVDRLQQQVAQVDHKVEEVKQQVIRYAGSGGPKVGSSAAASVMQGPQPPDPGAGI